MGFLYKIIGNITFYNDTNVTNDILYHYNVSAINAIGRGPHSDEIFATPKNGTGNITKTKPSLHFHQIMVYREMNLLG